MRSLHWTANHAPLYLTGSCASSWNVLDRNQRLRCVSSLGRAGNLSCSFPMEMRTKNKTWIRIPAMVPKKRMTVGQLQSTPLNTTQNQWVKRKISPSLFTAPFSISSRNMHQHRRTYVAAMALKDGSPPTSPARSSMDCSVTFLTSNFSEAKRCRSAPVDAKTWVETWRRRKRMDIYGLQQDPGPIPNIKGIQGPRPVA